MVEKEDFSFKPGSSPLLSTLGSTSPRSGRFTQKEHPTFSKHISIWRKHSPYEHFLWLNWVTLLQLFEIWTLWLKSLGSKNYRVLLVWKCHCTFPLFLLFEIGPHFPSAGITSMSQCWGIKSGMCYTLGKHSTNWATSPDQKTKTNQPGAVSQACNPSIQEVYNQFQAGLGHRLANSRPVCATRDPISKEKKKK